MKFDEISSTAVVHDPSVENPRDTRSSFPAQTEIAGYTLVERIGTGGFGEVWRAVGPGGFNKAVKLLFGGRTGPQAESELKALNRVRDLRHPFLLNIERVEVQDGRVIIVTELADRSLDQRYQDALASGLRGIPRDELLGYLRDAADALDFMQEQHGLQHLDIKPENLLLQGNHAKVGDFGLTKSVAITSAASFVSGFTPLYAPPELFEGRADKASDQYSLAIVYQVMLTGTPPFNGRTPAQLTSQHLRSSPDLSVLHPSDRPVVARALSKNPRTRFNSCRQFIDELARRRMSSGFQGPVQKSDSGHDAGIAPTPTELVDASKVGGGTARVLSPAKPLRPVSVPSRDVHLRPTVFVGLGGLGCRVLELLQTRLTAAFPGSTLPALQFLAIDSDPDSLNEFKRRAAQRAEQRQEVHSGTQTLLTALKSSHEYRKGGSDHLNWLSRRWLFNIPRSGRVEGMRPLGRLAIVTHIEAVREAIRRAASSAVRLESLNRSGTETGLPVKADSLDFVLIGAINGGTGSGGLMDIAWVARGVQNEGRRLPGRIEACLLHGTTPGPSIADMQDANAIAFLRELSHFSLSGVTRTNGAPCGSNGHTRPFDDTWLLHLGEDLTPLAFEEGAGQLVDYLELRTISPVRPEMDEWHEQERLLRSHDQELTLRTFGITRVSEDAWSMAHSEASHLCEAIVQQWLSHPAAPDDESQSALQNDLKSLLSELSLDARGSMELIRRMLRGDRTRRVEDYALSVWARMTSQEGSGTVVDRVADIVAADMQSPDAADNVLRLVLEEIGRELATSHTRAASRCEQLLRTVLDSRGRLAGAEDVMKSLSEALLSAHEMIESQSRELQQAFSETCTQAAGFQGPVTADNPALKPFCRNYCMLFLLQSVGELVASRRRTLQASIVRLGEEKIGPLRGRLKVLQNLAGLSGKPPATIPSILVQSFEDYLLTAGRFRLSRLQHADPVSSDASTLKTDAANFLLASVGVGSHTSRTEPESNGGSSFTAGARPRLNNVGGGQRVVAVTPEGVPPEVWQAQLAGEFGDCVSITSMPRQDICVCCETEGIAITAAIDSLAHLKPKVLELASRVHSRQDIPW